MKRNLAGFGVGASVGILGGLIGLGGAEFRLPILVGLFKFSGLAAVVLNKATSLIVVATALPFRAQTVPLGEIGAHWPIILNLLAGSLAGAYAGAAWATRLKSETLYRIIAVLLVLIAGVLLFAHDATAPAGPPVMGWQQILIGVVAGFAIGVVASLLGVIVSIGYGSRLHSRHLHGRINIGCGAKRNLAADAGGDFADFSLENVAASLARSDQDRRHKTEAQFVHKSLPPLPDVIERLKLQGHETSRLHCKPWNDFAGPNAPRMDFVVALCDIPREQFSQEISGQFVTAAWPLPDPAQFNGSRSERTTLLNELYAMIRRRIEVFTGLPFQSLDRKSLQEKLDEIGDTTRLTP